MTAPTSGERREVAATLRDAKRKCDERGYPWMTDDLCLAIGYEHDYEADNGIFDRLADLIEPPGEPIVRCKDCKHVYEHHDARGRWLLCNLQLYFEVKPEDFCSRGEKREDER